MYNMTAAVIGTGYMGKQHIKELQENVDTVIICGADEETGKKLADEKGCKFYSDYEEMFKNEKIDFVSICLPTYLHCDAVKKAAEYNINILCEKPFASSVEEAEEMLKAANEKNLIFMIGHCFRFSTRYEYLRRCLADNRFGKLISLNLYRHSAKPTWSVGNWLSDVSRSGGVLRDLHIHDTDAVEGLLGMPESVYTTGSAACSHTVYKFGENTDIYSSATWRNSKIPFASGYDAVFENATVKAEGVKIEVYTEDEVLNPLETEVFNEFFEDDNTVASEIRYFCYCLKNGLNPEMCRPEDSLKSMIINRAEFESLESRSEVKI